MSRFPSLRLPLGVALIIATASCGDGSGADTSKRPAAGNGAGATSGAGGVAPTTGGSAGTSGSSAATGGNGAAGTGVGGSAGSGGSPNAGTSPGGSAGASGAAGGAGGASGASVGGAGASGAGGAAGAAGSGAGAAGAAGSAGSGGGGAGESGEIGGMLAADSLAVRFADAVMARWPDPGGINGGIAAFEYNRGIVLVGIQRVYEGTKDQRYLDYIRRYIDEFVDANGNVNRPTEHSFDTMQPAVLLPFLFEQTSAAKYAMAADKIRALYDTIPKNADGGYWHKQQYPNEMWLDSMYMGEPFLAKYSRIRDCGTFCTDTIVRQMTLIAEHVRDSVTGLLYHAWDQDSNALWANATTGRSPVIWGRALGWYAMALVDLLPYLPAANPGRQQFLDILGALATGLQNTQDANGMWHQVVDQATRTDDWAETSASAMFVYSLKLASARGYIAASFADVAARGWQGLMGQITTDTRGPVINGAVEGMGVQVDYASYVNKQRLVNSSHGLCAIMLAASAMESR